MLHVDHKCCDFLKTDPVTYVSKFNKPDQISVILWDKELSFNLI